MQTDKGLRVALFTHALDGRAVSQVVIAVARAMTALGVQSSVITTSTEDGVVGNDVEVVRVGNSTGRTYRALPSLIRLLRRRPFDVLISHVNGPNRTAAVARILAGARRPFLIAVEHNHFSSYTWSFPVLRRLATRALYPLTDAIVAVSPGVQDDLASLLPRLSKKIRVIPPPLTRWDDIPSLIAAEPEHPWLLDGLPTITNVANVSPRKDQRTLIEALAILNVRGNPVRLLIIGRADDHEYASRLKALASELGVQHLADFLGFRDNPLSFVARSRAFVLSSVNEGMPLSLLEAMACNVPIISTDCPSGPGWLLEEGRCGLLVPMRDPSAMAEAIERVLHDPVLTDRLIAAGRERVESFSPQRIAHAYLDLVGG
ncbi:MAG: glycosyltransferase [Acidimicrobiia bacterium]